MVKECRILIEIDLPIYLSIQCGRDGSAGRNRLMGGRLSALLYIANCIYGLRSIDPMDKVSIHTIPTYIQTDG